ncbi:MAG: hypothetical protein SFU56_10705, partial [Capsulimonadales bacterium]|nr:hypothetical protein [Capsulimonadales bacterium]
VLLPFQVGNAVGLGLALRPIFPQVATMGNVVTLPNTHLVISSELSGLNVSIAVLVLTVWLALRRGVRYYNYPVLLVLGLLVALVVNFVRLWIMAVAINSNPDFGTGVGRISFWIPVLIAFFPVRWLVDRFRPRQLRHPGEGEGIR